MLKCLLMVRQFPIGVDYVGLNLSTTLKDATTRQLYAATNAALAGIPNTPRGIRYANTA